jgi:hypothetical protein
MARIKPISQIDSMSGKINRDDDLIYRTRNGQTHSYKLKNPYSGPLAESRKKAINLFAEASHRCTEEMNNPERLAFWKAEYERYLRRLNRRFFAPKDEKKYDTLRGFILASLHAQLKEQNA